LQVVLDSNVLISLLLFADPRYARISAAWQAGSINVLTDAACAAEFCRVLAYSRLKLDESRQQAIYAEFSRAARSIAAVAAAVPPLPKCKDADDQKFLELALSAGASLLVTGDKALLVLNRARYRLPFEILTADALERRLAENGIIRREK
jgi:putative PIN family toxin of toxin-antitoxin system